MSCETFPKSNSHLQLKSNLSKWNPLTCNPNVFQTKISLVNENSRSPNVIQVLQNRYQVHIQHLQMVGNFWKPESTFATKNSRSLKAIQVLQNKY